MNYFSFTRKIKIYSILAALLPAFAIGTCLLLYSFLSHLTLFTYYDNVNETADETIYPINKDLLDKSKSSFLACDKFILERNFILKNGEEIKINPKNINEDKEKKVNEVFENNNIYGHYYTKTTVIDDKCIKNNPILFYIISRSVWIEKNFTKIFTGNKSGFAKTKNPFIYGEVSISRTARYFPANFIFKPLIILSAIFLIFYWKNNLSVFNAINSKKDKKSEKFFFFGVISAIFLILHSIFLGVDYDNNIFKAFRKLVIILFILFEITAQVLLTKSLYENKNYIMESIRLNVLKTKIIFVFLIFIVTIYAFVALIFFDPSYVFKNVLEWNYFFALLLYYLMSFFLWRPQTHVHAPESA